MFITIIIAIIRSLYIDREKPSHIYIYMRAVLIIEINDGVKSMANIPDYFAIKKNGMK